MTSFTLHLSDPLSILLVYALTLAYMQKLILCVRD